MRPLTIVLTTLLAGLLVHTATAAATTVEVCQAQITALRAATADPTTTSISGKYAETKDRPGLLGKLDSAAADVAAKPATAINKLVDYRTKVEALIAAGRLTSAVDLVAATNEAIACVEAIGT